MSESEILESCSNAGKAGGRIMSSVAAAQHIMRDLGSMLAPDQPGKVRIDRIYRELSKSISTTRRRVRSLFFGEARRVDFDEMVALETLKSLQEARRARSDLAAKANTIAAFLAAEGAPLDSRQIRSLRGLVGDLDRPRIGGA
jgi:hypothetical protein